MSKGLERYVGSYVTTKVAIPSDRRGERIPAGTSNLLIESLNGTQHFNLVYPGGRRAANQVHYSKLFLS